MWEGELKSFYGSQNVSGLMLKKKSIYDLHKKCLNNCVTLNPLHLQKSGVLAFTCNLATLKAEFWNGLGSVPGGSDDPSIGESIV